ncbi:MAG: D-Ala-D-Ala carboxypeptidase family metallohydrolase [Polyangiaceae bacterium]
MKVHVRRSLFGFALAAAASLVAGSAFAGPAPLGDAPAQEEIAPPIARVPTPLDRAPRLYTFKLAESASALTLLRAYLDAEVERPGPYNRYVAGAYGRWSKAPWFALAWGASAHEEADASPAGAAQRDTATGSEIPAIDADATSGLAVPLMSPDAAGQFGFAAPESEPLRVRIGSSDWITRLFVADDRAPFWTTGPSLASNGYGGLFASSKPVVDWRCRRRPVLFIRYGGENDRFSLVQCTGAIEPGAVDRLSILARPPEVPDPGELPDEPDPEAWEKSGEWLPRVKLVNPRLLWLLQKIADAFPHRAVYVYSGYRPHKDKSVLQGHHSMHGDGRAMDIQVHGVRNEALFAFCRKLDDVGCGYYPNSKFVHVDVRKPGTGHAFWIDTSGPGEPSHYVDSWPGVVEHGALAWMTVPARDALPQGPRPRTPDERGTADVIRK